MPTFTTLDNFNNAIGTDPVDGFITDAAGNIFYTGAGSTTGTFEITDNTTLLEIPNSPTGYASTPTALVNFSISFGPEPVVLFANEAGDLFGETFGELFEIAKTASGYASTPTTVVAFPYVTGMGDLTTDAAGDLFFTSGAAFFEAVMTPSGYASTPTVFPQFYSLTQAAPDSGWVADATGNLFNTVATGEAYGYGGVLELPKTVSGYASTPTVLASFNNADGSDPVGSVVVDANGDLFGVTETGSGANAGGTVFEIVKTAGGYASTPTTLVSFNTIDGSKPVGGLIIDADGDLFGMTSAGGMDGLGSGTVFEVANSATGYASTPITLTTFFNYAGGLDPKTGLTSDGAGDLFGATSQGGPNGEGTLFQITNSGFQTVAGGNVSTAPNSATTAGGATSTVDAGSANGAYTVPAGAAEYVTSESNNTIYATTGAPTISASTGNPLVFAGNTSLDFIGGSGTATVIGGASGNTVQGGSGGLLLFAVSTTSFTPGTGTSAIIGGAGGLTATLGAGGGEVFGGTGGVNTLSVAAGGSANAVLVGDGTGDVLTDAGAGSDILVAGAGAETLNAVAATGNSDAFFGGTGADCIIGGSQSNVFLIGSGNETLIGSSGANQFDIVAGTTVRTETIENFTSLGDFINLFGYSSDEPAALCASAVVTSSGTTLTLPDNTTVFLAGYTGHLQPETYVNYGRGELGVIGNVA